MILKLVNAATGVYVEPAFSLTGVHESDKMNLSCGAHSFHQSFIVPGIAHSARQVFAIFWAIQTA